MAAGENSSFLGPSMFFGLSIYVLVTSSPVEPDYANPADLMDLDTVTRAAMIRVAGAYFPDRPPVAPQPPAPQAFAATNLADPNGSEPVAEVATARVIPELSLTPQALSLPPSVASLVLPVPAADARLARGTPDPVTVTQTGKGYDAAPHDWLITNGDLINLRTGPGIEFPSITQFDTGARGLRLRAQGDWIHIQFFETSTNVPLNGWMFSDYLSPDRP